MFGGQLLQVLVNRLTCYVEAFGRALTYVFWVLFDILQNEPSYLLSSRPNPCHWKPRVLSIVNLMSIIVNRPSPIVNQMEHIGNLKAGLLSQCAG
jgi:hypothetical protein